MPEYQPRNRNVAPDTFAFDVGPSRVRFYVDDIHGDRTPMTYGRPGSPVRVTSYRAGRFTLVDDRGRFLKQPRPYRGEGKRRVRSFPSAALAGLFAVENDLQSCE